MVLSREQLLQLQDLHTVKVALPDNMGEVSIRALSLAEVQEYNKQCAGMDEQGAAALLAAYALVDEQGNQLFDPKKDAEVSMLRKKAGFTVLRIAEAANRLSVAGKNEVEKLLKNYKKTSSDSGSSDSVSTSE